MKLKMCATWWVTHCLDRVHRIQTWEQKRGLVNNGKQLERGLQRGLHSEIIWFSFFLWPVLIRAAVRLPLSFSIPLHTPEASGTSQRLNPRDSISTLTMRGIQGVNGKRVSPLNSSKLNVTCFIWDLCQTHCGNISRKVSFWLPLMFKCKLVFKWSQNKPKQILHFRIKSSRVYWLTT